MAHQQATAESAGAPVCENCQQISTAWQGPRPPQPRRRDLATARLPVGAGLLPAAGTGGRVRRRGMVWPGRQAIWRSVGFRWIRCGEARHGVGEEKNELRWRVTRGVSFMENVVRTADRNPWHGPCAGLAQWMRPTRMIQVCFAVSASRSPALVARPLGQETACSVAPQVARLEVKLQILKEPDFQNSFERRILESRANAAGLSQF